MKLNTSDIAHGIPTLLLRRALRANQHGNHTTSGFAQLLKLEPTLARSVLAKLSDAGLLTEDARSGAWENTLQGNAFANATAAKKITRATAQKALAELLSRASAINLDPKFAYIVKRISVFGSYLTNATQVSDVDVFIELRKRFEDPKRQRDLEDQVERRIPATGSPVQNIYRAEREIWKALKGGSRALQIASCIPDGAASEVIFDQASGPS